jgi:hypothetical protein
VLCPSCNQRKARRACPALSQTICTVCCGTKRLVEIRCPADCVYLNAAREHPAAVVRKQQERDVAMLLPSIRHLTERQHQLFFLFHSVIAQGLARAMKTMMDEIRAQGTKVYDAEAAIALRAIELGARETARESTEPAGYLALVGRLLRVDQATDRAARPEPEGTRPGSIILP